MIVRSRKKRGLIALDMKKQKKKRVREDISLAGLFLVPLLEAITLCKLKKKTR
jgi:hypothetical protein